MPATARTPTIPRRPPALRGRLRGSRRWRGWRLRFACAALLWSAGCADLVVARETPPSRSAPKPSHSSAPMPRPGRDPGRAIQRRPSVALDDPAAARREAMPCPGLSSRSSETQRQSRRGACLRRAQAQDRAGQNGPSSHSQRAIQALTKAIRVVKGKPMRRKSPKRY